MKLRLVLVAVAVVAVAAAVPVGRLEGARFDDAQNDGIARVRRAVGPLEQPALSHYRVQIPRELPESQIWFEMVELTCLIYRRGQNPLALELCFDSQGRLIEAVDRRGGRTRRWSLRSRPEAAKLKEDPNYIFFVWHSFYERVRAEAVKRLEASRSHS